MKPSPRSKFLIAAFAALALASASAASLAADIEVRVKGVQGNEGNLMFAVFEVGNFLKKPTLVARSSLAEASASFKNLAPGSYAVVVFQDLNSNGELDRNLFGAPTEPLGFSNDAAARMGPPKFEAAAIKISDANLSILLTLR